jgi:hypothetical protein
MLWLRAYAPAEQADVLGARLAPLTGVRHLVIGGQTSGGMTELTGDVDADAADRVLEVLREYELGAEDVSLSGTRCWDGLGPTLDQASSTSCTWWRRGRGRRRGVDRVVHPRCPGHGDQPGSPAYLRHRHRPGRTAPEVVDDGVPDARRRPRRGRCLRRRCDRPPSRVGPHQRRPRSGQHRARKLTHRSGARDGARRAGGGNGRHAGVRDGRKRRRRRRYLHHHRPRRGLRRCRSTFCWSSRSSPTSRCGR